MKFERDEHFHRFVLERRTELLRTATLLTAGDVHLAEDVVQTTLTKLYVAWPRFSSTRNPDAYARTALVNAVVDESRRPWRRREATVQELPEYAARERGENSTADDVHRALAGLPTRMRAAVVFRFYYDLSVAETADLLSCSQGTVKSQTARALDKLRETLGSLSTDDHSVGSQMPTPNLTLSPRSS